MMNQLSQAQEEFQLLDRIPIGVCVLRSDQVVLFWNSCLEEWTKISREQIVGTCISDRFSHFKKPLYTKRFEEIFQGGLPTIFSSQLHPHLIPAPLPQGHLRIQHTTVTAISADDGSGFYAMLSLQDVTDLTFRVRQYRNLRDQALSEAEAHRRAQERAEAANRVKDEFLAIVSHELRTPLSPILGWSKLLKGGKLSGGQLDRAIETIERNAQLQARLIDDLLDVSRILRGKLNLNWDCVSLADVIESALETVKLSAEAKSIDLQCHLITPDIQVMGDASRLQQIVWNLVSNAIKFTPSDGRIAIELTTADLTVPSGSSNFAKVIVRDTGKGISPEFLPHVFEYFRQADSTTTRNTGGLGLGLAIVRHLVELHGGTIAAESPGEDQGATFIVTLPCLRLETGDRRPEIFFPPAPLTPHPSLLSHKTILVVDDDPDTRDLLAFLLQEQGAGVILAASAQEALAAIASCKLDLLISDIGMPEADGYDLIRQLRSLPPESGGKIPAIALTAFAAETTRQQVLKAGFHRHLAKPVDPLELVNTIANLVQSSQASLYP